MRRSHLSRLRNTLKLPMCKALPEPNLVAWPATVDGFGPRRAGAWLPLALFPASDRIRLPATALSLAAMASTKGVAWGGRITSSGDDRARERPPAFPHYRHRRMARVCAPPRASPARKPENHVPAAVPDAGDPSDVPSAKAGLPSAHGRFRRRGGSGARVAGYAPPR